ncbi:hypothetical protein [Nocardioides litoris]|uniref:hypothetical protein n=1 Tax=Nocardioides litoris TaxID=1926648 RepID=UPI0011211CC6|nr:hypothetical protein [Nocardioides litoris]
MLSVRALALVLAAALLPLLPVPAAPSSAEGAVVLPVEAPASYEPATRCAPAAKPGTRVLARWLERRHGSHTSISRSCRPGQVTSEHQEGRAVDWSADARTPAGRRAARRLLRELLAPDAAGEAAALARRMGVMYLIWDDHLYAAWRGFEPEPYLSSSCRSRRRCSPTLRHRDHVHVSLTRRAARGETSWYLRQPPRYDARSTS